MEYISWDSQRRLKYSNLLEQRARAVTLRAHVLSYVRSTNDLDTANQWVCEYLEDPECRPLHSLSDAIGLLPNLAPGWEVMWIKLKFPYYRIKLIDRSERNRGRYTARFVSKHPQVALTVAILAVHINHLEELLEDIKKPLTNQDDPSI